MVLSESQNFSRERTFSSDIVRYLIALLLLGAAAIKIHQILIDQTLTNGFSTPRWLQVIAVIFELLFGTWLLNRPFTILTSWISIIFFALVSIISLYKALSGAQDCGCFGAFSVNPWYTTAIDVSAIVLVARWSPLQLLSDTHQSACKNAIQWHHLLKRRLFLITQFWLLVIVPIAVGVAAYDFCFQRHVVVGLEKGDFVVLEPHDWVGRSFPLLEDIDIGERIRESDWLVILYHHDCSRCEETIGKLPQLVRKWGVKRVALIEFPKASPADGDTSIPDHTINVLAGKLSNRKNWFAQTPIVLELSGGRVIKVHEMTQS